MLARVLVISGVDRDWPVSGDVVRGEEGRAEFDLAGDARQKYIRKLFEMCAGSRLELPEGPD